VRLKKEKAVYPLTEGEYLISDPPKIGSQGVKVGDLPPSSRKLHDCSREKRARFAS